MKVSCQTCEARFKIDDSKIPAQGLTLNCPKCKSPITVKKESTADESEAFEADADVPQPTENIAAPPEATDEMDDFLGSLDDETSADNDQTQVDLPPEAIALPGPEPVEENKADEVDFSADEFAEDAFDAEFDFDEPGEDSPAETVADDAPATDEAISDDEFMLDDAVPELNDDFSLDDALADLDDSSEGSAKAEADEAVPDQLDDMFSSDSDDFNIDATPDENALDMPSMLENAAQEMESNKADELDFPELETTEATPEAIEEEFSDQGFSFDDMIGEDSVKTEGEELPSLELTDNSSPEMNSQTDSQLSDDIFSSLPSLGETDEKVTLFHVKRHNGKVFGPFPVSAIIEMIDEGKLQGTEEVSTDNANWKSITEVEDFSQHVEEAKSKGVLDTFLPEETSTKRIDKEKAKVREENKIRRKAGSLDVVSPMKKKKIKFSAKVVVPILIILALAGGVFYLEVVEELSVIDILSGKSISDMALKDQLKTRHKAQYDKVEAEIEKDNYQGYTNARKILLNVLKTPDFRGVGAMWTLLAQVDYQLLRRYGFSSEISKEVSTAMDKVKALRQDELEVMIANASESMHQKTYSKARDTYLKVINRSPKNYKALHWLVESYLYMPDPTPAQKYLDTIIQDKQATAATWYLSGKLLDLTDKKEEAKKSFMKALEMDPQHLDSQIELAGILIDEPGGINRAERELESIRNTFKEKLSAKQMAKVHYYSAKIYEKRNEPYKIVKELMAAIGNEPDNYLYNEMLGSFYYGRHELAKAEEQLALCIKNNTLAIRCRLDLAKTMIDLDHADRALFKLEETEKLVPNNAEVFFLLGKTYEKLFKPQKALAMYEKAIKLDPNGVEYYTSAAMSYLKQDNLTKAGEYIGNAKLIQANSPLVFNFLGQMHQYQGDLGKAEIEFKKAIEADKTNIDSHFHLANIYRETERYTEAIEQYEAILNLDDKYSDAYFGLGRTYYKMEENDKAISEFEKALNLTNRFQQYFYYAGLAYYKKGDLEKAQSAFEKAAHLEISDAEPVYYLGRILSEEKLYDESVEYFEKAIQLNDKKAEYFYHYGWLLEKQEKYGEAIEMFDKALALNKKYAEVYLRKGITLRALNKYLLAIKNFKLAQKYNPEISMALMELGECYFEMRKYKFAIKQFKKTIELVPESVNAHLKMGLVYQEMGKPKKAIVYLKKAVKLDGENPKIRLALGYSYKALKQRSNAVREFKKYLELEPDAIDSEEVESEIYYLEKRKRRK